MNRVNAFKSLIVVEMARFMAAIVACNYNHKGTFAITMQLRDNQPFFVDIWATD